MTTAQAKKIVLAKYPSALALRVRERPDSPKYRIISDIEATYEIGWGFRLSAAWKKTAERITGGLA